MSEKTTEELNDEIKELKRALKTACDIAGSNPNLVHEEISLLNYFSITYDFDQIAEDSED